MLDAFHRYRDTNFLRYIKLLDGGLTDNFGVEGVALARLTQGQKYAPLNRDRAVMLKRFLFVVEFELLGDADEEHGHGQNDGIAHIAVGDIVGRFSFSEQFLGLCRPGGGATLFSISRYSDREKADGAPSLTETPQ